MRDPPRASYVDGRGLDVEALQKVRSTLSATLPPMALVVDEAGAAALRKAGDLADELVTPTLPPPDDAVGWFDRSPVFVRTLDAQADTKEAEVRELAAAAGVDVEVGDDMADVALKLLRRREGAR